MWKGVVRVEIHIALSRERRAYTLESAVLMFCSVMRREIILTHIRRFSSLPGIYWPCTVDNWSECMQISIKITRSNILHNNIWQPLSGRKLSSSSEVIYSECDESLKVLLNKTKQQQTLNIRAPSELPTMFWDGEKSSDINSSWARTKNFPWIMANRLLKSEHSHSREPTSKRELRTVCESGVVINVALVTRGKHSNRILFYLSNTFTGLVYPEFFLSLLSHSFIPSRTPVLTHN